MVTTPTLWKDQFQANTTDPAFQGDSQIAALGDGGYVVVWTDRSGVHSPVDAVIMQRYSIDGLPVGGEVEVQIQEDVDQIHPAVASRPDGGVAVAIVDDFAPNSIYVRHFDSNLGLVRTDSLLPSAKVRDPSLTFFADGSCLVTYTVGSGSDTDIVGQIVSSSGVVGARFDILNETDNSRFSEVATLSNGNAVVVLQNEFAGSATDTDIHYAIIGPAGGFVRPLDTVGGATGGATEEDADVVALKGGGFVVVWTDSAADGSGPGIQGTLYDNAGNFITSFDANTSTTGAQTAANVVALADGGFVVSWNDAGANKVRAQRFDASAAAVGIEFDVKTGLAGAGPEAALLGDGRFAYALDHASMGDQDVATSIFDPRTSPINGSAGNDRITSRREGATVNGGEGHDELIGLGGIDVLNGGDGSDILRGRGGDDVMNGNRDDDTLFGSSGNDTMIGGNGADHADYSLAEGAITVFLAVSAAQNTGGAGIDTLSGIENLNGSGFDDNLTGTDGTNFLFGGLGNDELRGGRGQDFLTGGANDDVFRYLAVNESGVTELTRDRIGDFALANDKIHLADIDANTLAAGNQAFTFIGAAAFSGVAGQLQSVRTGPITLISGDVNGDSLADFQIQLDIRLVLNAGNFVP